MKTGIALGSNLGDRGAHLHLGFKFLRSLSTSSHFLASSFLQTEPVDCPPGSPPFFNAAAEIEWNHDIMFLLEKLQQFEKDNGRLAIRPLNAPRPIDLDILYHGNHIRNEPRLILPHPRLFTRRFVLQPLAEIRPDLLLPGQSRTIAQLLHDLP
jgi:2-amino-4-hydroxy-6-hydroxymethyldihydropteridine diphosphokinase